MSSMRSASSITSRRVSVSSRPPRSNMSISRPGVAISTSTPRISRSFWSDMLSPPMMSAWVSFRVLAVLDEILRHLQRQFAGRLQDEAARHARPCPAAGQDVEHRQGEAGGFAGAGLRAAQQVAPHQHPGDGLRLDRRRRAVALFLDGAHDRLGQAERGEAGLGQFFGQLGIVAGRLIAGRLFDEFGGARRVVPDPRVQPEFCVLGGCGRIRGGDAAVR